MTLNYQQQLVLGFPEQDDQTFATYYGGPNQAVVDRLQGLWQQDHSQDNLYLWGSKGSGRTHLLQALVQDALTQERSAYYLDVFELSVSSELDSEHSLISAIEGLAGMDLICFDNIEAIAGDLAWEEAIFHLYNRMLASGGYMVFSGGTAPRYLEISLQDLKSRLSHSLIFQIASLNDEEKCMAFKHRAAERGIRFSTEVANYIMSRSQRQFASLIELLDRLDRRSLVEKRRITIPFVKEVMGW